MLLLNCLENNFLTICFSFENSIIRLKEKLQGSSLVVKDVEMLF